MNRGDLGSQILADDTHFQIVGEAADGVEAAQKAAAELRPDVILLDIGLPTVSGIDVAKQIHGLVQDAKVIFLSRKTDPEVVHHVLSNGAKGM